MSSQDGGIPVPLRGISGAMYQFAAYPKHFSWNEVPGVYAILKWTGTQWIVLYVGEAENLKQRLSGHHRQTCFDRNGWTHLAFLHESSGVRRLAIERDVMEAYQPTCNKEV